MAWSTEKSVVAGFGLGVVLLLALAAEGYRSLNGLTRATQQVVQTSDALDALADVRVAVTDAETGARGYVLSGDDEHLTPYHAAVAGMESQLARLGDLTADQPGERELVDLLRRRVGEVLATLKETVDARKRYGPDGAWKGFLADKGKQRMDPVRRTVAAIETAQTELLRRRTAQQAATVTQATMVLSAGGVLAVVLVALAGGLLRGDIATRRRVEDALQRANVKLTGWVEEMDQRGREIMLLGEMGDLLRSCRAEAEAYGVIGEFAPRLFPDASGLLGVLAATKTSVDGVAMWGSAPAGDRSFAPSACWALRRQRLHAVDDPDAGPLCGHINQVVHTGYVCVPMLVQGELLGVLHLQATPEEWQRRGTVPPHVKEARRQLALSVTQHIALALANLRLQETLRGQAIRDPLTDLFNRRYMEESLAREIRRARRNGTPLGIIMLDIDHFKRFNDTYGHEAGDVLLRAMASFIKAHVRGEDIACRYGGEEFTLILPGASLQVSKQRAEFIREGVKDLSVSHEGQPLGPVTLSLGVAIFPDHGETGDAVLRVADTALYQAKQEGRNRVIVAT
jgi:diguanylate cyclase (GGDEF)-like protein